MMYLSMQDGKNLFSAGNNTNIQDTSNNFPYGSSLQAEMSTCISNGCNSNQMTTLLSNQQQLKNNLSTNRGVTREASQNKQSEFQKLNGSVEEMNLFYLLSCLGNMKPAVEKSQD